MYVKSAATPSKVAGVVVSNSSTTPASTACAAVSATSTRTHPARHWIEPAYEESERSQSDIASSSPYDAATACGHPGIPKRDQEGPRRPMHCDDLLIDPVTPATI